MSALVVQYNVPVAAASVSKDDYVNDKPEPSVSGGKSAGAYVIKESNLQKQTL